MSPVKADQAPGQLQAFSACVFGDDRAAWPRVLTPIAVAGAAPATAICRSETHLFTCGRDVLSVYDIAAEQARPRLLCQLPGINFGRQMLLHRRLLFITARYYGLYIVDVTDPAQPALLKNYTTLELATGIAVAGDLLYVSLRTYGVELIDISDPANPRHLSLFRSRESQSCCVFGDRKLAVGNWYHGSLALVDTADPLAPRLLSETLLRGYGDGVAVVGQTCYVSTGHHRLGKAPREEWLRPPEEDRGWGHGLEIVDISDPRQPLVLSRVQFPRCTTLRNDYWTPYVVGDTVFVADTHNGLFVIDATDKRRPRCVAQLLLPSLPTGDMPGCVSSLAFADGLVYIAANEQGLFTVAVPEARYVPTPESRCAVKVSAPRIAPAGFVAADIAKAFRVALSGDGAFVAADDQGIAYIEFAADGGAKVLRRSSSTGCYDVAVHGDVLYAAERYNCCRVYRIGDGGALTSIAAITTDFPRIVKCLHVVANGRLLFMSGGHGCLDVYDVSEPTLPRRVHTTQGPLFYSDSLPNRDLNGMMLINRYWLGARFLDLNKEPPEERCDFELFLYQLGGAEALKRHFIAVGKQDCEYQLFDPVTLTVRVGRSDGVAVTGIPTFDGDRTVVFADRKSGEVKVFDVSDETHARFIPERSFAAPQFNPERVVFRNGKMLVPLREQGLIIEQ
ncbi:MAG: LVIVD repeat-containing protein [Lentisphaeria bacterium]|jgi:hypothetical protein